MMEEKMMAAVLPLRDIVVFPHMIVPLFVGRSKSIHALDQASEDQSKHIFLITQKDSSIESPTEDALYKIGTLGQILQLLKLPDGTVKVLVEGIQRIQVFDFFEEDEVLFAHAKPCVEHLSNNDECVALRRSVQVQFERYAKLNKKTPPDILENVLQIEDPSKLSDIIIAYSSLKLEKKQDLLEKLDINQRLEEILIHIESEASILQVEKRIRTRVRKQMEKTQREYFLSEQLKAIHKELGDGDEEVHDEFKEFEQRIKKTKLSKEALSKATSELKKLCMMNPSSAESTVTRAYLDWILGIPWNQRSRVKKDLKEAEDILHKDHFGLEKVKERILEYLAVQSRVGKVKGQILCLVGPPGVGKTSLGKSIARATGRSFVRVALGGIRDESEIRGHRRTYIGSMPGRIIQGMKKAKTSNPLFLLDEIDKLGSDWRGDPSSALLEVFDPEQNTAFNDHYIEVDYDLSDVMFITTANTLNIPSPLLDRMEVIHISGYTEDEKIAIATQYLVPKQFAAHGLKDNECTIGNDIILHLIRRYTRESGVRNLEREIAKLARKVIRILMSNPEKKNISISQESLEQFSGVPRYQYSKIDQDDSIGVTTGLAWTEAGGDLLSIETIRAPGKGKLQITGKLGDVMQESVQAAISYIRSQAPQYGLASEIFEKCDIHVHVPEGATPKDGPSAGIAICTSVISALTNIPVIHDVAMTGEITLRGHVLAIGGLKEKLLAALRGEIQSVLIPFANKKDLSEIPMNVKEGLNIIFVKTMDDVLPYALVRQPVPIPFVFDELSSLETVQQITH